MLTLGDVERESEKVREALERVVQQRNKVTIVYGPYTRGLAKLCRLALKLWSPSTAVEVVDVDSFPTMELPYTSEHVEALIAFLRSHSRLYRLATVARLLQVESLAITIPPPETIKKALRGFEILELSSESYVISSILGILKFASVSSEARASRVKDELSIDRELVREVTEKLSGIREVLSGKTLICSSAIEPLCDEVKALGGKAMHMHEALATSCVDAILAYTSCEDQVASEFVLNYVRSCPRNKLTKIRVNTDPLTASLYLLIALKEVEG